MTKTDQMIVHESKRIKASKAAQRKALLSNNPQVLPELYFNWFFGPITVIVIRIWGFVLCHQLFSSPIKDQGRLPFTPSIRVEILGVNIQCCRFSKRKMGRSENVLASIGKFKRKRKNALIKSIAYYFWNVSNGMVCTISFSIQNFRVFRVNGKRPRFGACLWKVPRTFRARKASCQTAVRLFLKADLLACFKWKTKRTAKFYGLEPQRCEDIKGIIAPEKDPKSFGTFEKRVLGKLQGLPLFHIKLKQLKKTLP